MEMRLFARVIGLKCLQDVFGGAIGFELFNDTENECVQYAKDVIDAEEKQYQKLADEIIASG